MENRSEVGLEASILDISISILSSGNPLLSFYVQSWGSILRLALQHYNSPPDILGQYFRPEFSG